MSTWLQIMLMLQYMAITTSFAVQRDWPRAFVYLCYGSSLVGLMLAQTK